MDIHKTMASEVFLSQSELSPKIQLSNIDFVKNKKIKRQIGQDDWLYLTINEEFIEIQIDSEHKIDLKTIRIVNHLILKEIFNIPDIFISVSERLGISLFQKDLDENTANIMERLKVFLETVQTDSEKLQMPSFQHKREQNCLKFGISLFQKDLDENTANIMERLKKNKDLDPLQIL
jgi:hypothetical protein